MQINLRSYFVHPLARGLNIDASVTTSIRRRIIREKHFLRRIYQEWYLSILNSLPKDRVGPILELGSGGGFLKDYLPGLVTSEILQIREVDIILNGQCLPFKKGSLQGIVMVDVFHHFPCAKAFITDAALCVKPGGFIIMIEPWVTRWSRLIYKFLHQEPFNPGSENWEFPKGGPLSQANSALAWLVFERDRATFEKKFSEWKIKDIRLHTPFCYLLSGGVAMRTLIPGYFFNLWRRLENALQPWMRSWAMFATITLERCSFNDPVMESYIPDSP